MAKKGIVKKLADDQVKAAPRAVLEDLFDDFYAHRKQIYWMNFIRGIFLGFGTVVGGTIIVALLLWLLTALQYVPFIDGISEAVHKTIEQGQRAK